MVIAFIVPIKNLKMFILLFIYFLFSPLECKFHESGDLDFFAHQLITRIWYSEMLDVSVVVDVQ